MSSKDKIIIKTIQPYTYTKKGKIIEVKKSFPRKYHTKKTKIKFVKKKAKLKPKPKTNIEEKRMRELQDLQLKRRDWVHLSSEYPNIISLTDEQINSFINKRIELSYPKIKTEWQDDMLTSIYNSSLYKSYVVEDYPKVKNMSTDEFKKFVKEKYPFGINQIESGRERRKIHEYISKIKCLNQDDLLNLSEKAHKSFNKEAQERFGNHPINPYSLNKTVFVSSPRGGFEVLSDFSYANHLQKYQLPVDFYSEEYKGDIILSTTSLPYDYKLQDVNDIVYIDDICMSSEQEDKAFKNLGLLIERLKISKTQKPRLHYIALIGNKEKFKEDDKGNLNVYYGHQNLIGWDSVSVGEMHDFELNEKTRKHDDVSAVVFPFSIPDGTHHDLARQLYHSAAKYRHI